MLVLSRKQSERVIIDDHIVVTIVRVSGGTVRVGIEAPAHVPIRREGLLPAAGNESQPLTAVRRAG
jgi:carbon storage regulator